MKESDSNGFMLADHAQLARRVDAIQPLSYIRNRNFLDGDVTRLSPFITHGVISVVDLAIRALRDHEFARVEKFLFQLAWREFFHRVWQARGDEIFSDMKRPQPRLESDLLSRAIDSATTGVEVLDRAINTLYETGYMHNHARMWTASVASNVARSRWQTGARWMYYHLLDGDLASNTLSWQWVAGSFSSRCYLANQDNLNKYSRSEQRGTFLDRSYETLASGDVPDILEPKVALELGNAFPASTLTRLPKGDEPLLLYHPFGLDPAWRANESGRRILLIEPACYEDWPLGPARWRFIAHWASAIKGLEIFAGSLEELLADSASGIEIISREYPLTRHWPGIKDPRDWLAPDVYGDFPSFFKFWKQARKNMRDRQW